MIKALLTSSVLILALLILRRVFRGTLSRRVQYALWALVLARLLLPVDLPTAGFSLLTAARPVEEAVRQQVAARPVYLPVARVHGPLDFSRSHTVPERADIPAGGSAWVVEDAETAVEYRHIPVGQVLTVLWWGGMLVVGLSFLGSNLRFYLRLRRCRKPFAPAEPVSRRVYVVPDRAIPSPCLFGTAIYLTASVAGDDGRRDYVLAHEETHARHLDPLWSLLRCVCLTVYWFDPLVWAASACAQVDCELACDEGVLAGLGEADRLAYGQALLSLIPVKRGGSPLLTATSMTAGKKQLKDRIARIAHQPRQLLAATLIAALLAGLLAACAFTADGGGEARALTGAELWYFNENFFNSPFAADDSVYHLRNQFANPLILYDRPEEIDLFQLLYCEPGEGDVTPQEEALLGWSGEDCPIYKLTADDLNSLLARDLGLTLEETERVGLDRFAYLEEYDAYYWQHGDTNYCGALTFLSGTRSRDTVTLYQNSGFLPGWYRVTLEETGDGWRFLSNQPCEHPVIPTALPEGEPAAVIPLDGPEPYAPPPLERDPAWNAGGGDVQTLENWNIDGHPVRLLLDGTGAGAAAVWEGEEPRVFLTGLGSDARMGIFRDVLGRDGFYIAYAGEIAPYGFGTFYDYFYFTDAGTLALLARAANAFEEPKSLDLDGDGIDELATEYELFFLRDGAVFRADLRELLAEHYPQLTFWDLSSWDVYRRCLNVWGFILNENGEDRDCLRSLYFDGESLRVYRQEKPYHDHLVDGVDAGIPAPVVAAARAYVEDEVLGAPRPDGTWLTAEGFGDAEGAVMDDWRLDYFKLLCDETREDIRLVGYAFNYELHTATPDRIILAGGRYLDEDDWASPGYPGCDCLFFQVDGDSWTLLRHDMINDMGPSSLAFQRYVDDLMTSLGA